MAKRVFTSGALTFTASAAGSTTASSTFMALKGGTTIQTIDVLEIMITGKATSSTVAAMELARCSTLGTTPTALASPTSDGPMHPATSPLANVPVSYIASGANPPIPSNAVTDAKLNLALNLFGGIVRWNAAPTQQWTIVGSAVTNGESILWNNSSAGGSSGLADAHWIYEPF